MVQEPAALTLVVVGQGYVGLPMALRATECGISVVGLDQNAATVAALNQGSSHIDDVSDDDLATALASGYRASTDVADLAAADVVLVCVPTPLSSSGGPDLAAVEAAARAIGEQVRPGTLVVLESTTYPGTTTEVFAPLVTRDRLTVGEDVFIAFSPERIDPGNATYGVRNTPKVVGGITPECTRRATAFYERFVDTVVPARGVIEAEMSKLIENTFRHVNIALVNEMLRFCHDLDIDLWDAIDCASTKPFGFMAFRPGPGVGGHCIPVDPSYLSHRVKARLGYSFRMVELAEEVNTAAPLYVAERIRTRLNDEAKAVRGSRILLLGVTYKPGVRDMRESPADPLFRRLSSWGAEISFYDPLVTTWRPKGTDTTLETVGVVEDAAADADLVVLLQPHPGVDWSAVAERSRIFLDTRATLPVADPVVRL